KTDAGQNRDYWPFFQLEHFITYKTHLAGVAVWKKAAEHTRKNRPPRGGLGPRKKNSVLCPRRHYHAHADCNAAQEIRDWHGLCCPLVLEAPADGAHGMPLSTVRDTAS